MPRQARLDTPGALHHIMVRGINKTKIFRDDQDRRLFLERMEKAGIGDVVDWRDKGRGRGRSEAPVKAGRVS
jgi:hypothetical protein